MKPPPVKAAFPLPATIIHHPKLQKTAVFPEYPKKFSPDFPQIAGMLRHLRVKSGKDSKILKVTKKILAKTA